MGNRTSQTVNGVTTTFTINSDDELTATSGGFVNSYGYNANGEQTSRTLAGTAYTLAYDYEGQLTSITQGGNTTSFTYDAIGRRVSRTAGGTTTTFQFGGGVLLEKQGATTTATYTYGNALLRKDGEYPLFDGLGSERTVTNSSQTVTGTITFDGFGQTVTSTGSSTNPYMFGATSGYRTEGDAGLMQVGARYYDAQVGRFITRDTDLDQHPYLYCNHDPVNYVDLNGYWPTWTVIGGFVGGIVGCAVGGFFGGLVGGPGGAATGAWWVGRLGAGLGAGLGSYYGDHNGFWPSVGNGLVGGILGPYAGKVAGGMGGAAGKMLFYRGPLGLARQYLENPFGTLLGINKILK